VSRVSRLAGRGEGSVIGGEVALRVDPGLVARLGRSMKVALVSGTNGKTTTTTLLAAGLATIGPTATNRTGANLANGLAGALLAAPDRAMAALEVDEAVLPWALRELEPAAVALLNLSRDQLDRLHEVRATARRWRTAITDDVEGLVVANADDPLVVWSVGDDRPAERVAWVGAGLAWRHDSSACPWCDADLEFEPGGWRCPGCERSRPRLDYSLADDTVIAADGRTTELHLALPGRSARANAAMALAVIDRLAFPTAAAVAAWSQIRSIEGRFQRVTVSGADLTLHLAKNPAGWTDLLDLVDDTDGPLIMLLNAQGQDGRDPSWIWDVPFETLAGRRVVCLGERGLDLAVRLDYAGVEVERATGLADAARRVGPGTADLIANYSAFQQVRAELDRSAS
jgi:lipid II isoglutaminyl synthase (glutamine-hydrolysing)